MKPRIALWLAMSVTASPFARGFPLHTAPTIRAAHPSAIASTRVVPNDNRAAAGQLRAGVLSVRLVARVALWQPEGSKGPEIPIYAFAEEGGQPRIPGPLLRVPVGTEVRATFRNSLPQPLRLFGLHDRPSSDVDSLELSPGETRELHFRAGERGTYLYWGRTSRDSFPFGVIEDGQLSGAFVVDSTPVIEQRLRGNPPADRVFVIGLWKARETSPGTPVERREETLVLNGLAWPHTERLAHVVGDSIRWRVINATRRGHPMHLHGFYFRVDARGTAIYHTHFNESRQLGAGLYGPLLVLEPGEMRDTVTDRILLMGADGPFPDSPPSLDGQITPPPIELREGTTYRLRLISIAANDTKIVRLLSDTVVQRWRAVGKDGAKLPPHQATARAARVVMGAGETWDLEYTSGVPQQLTLEVVTIGRVALPPLVTRVPVHVRPAR